VVQHASLQIEVSLIVIHNTDKPDIAVNFCNLFVAQTHAATLGDDDGLVVEGIIDIGQSLIHTGGRLIDLGQGLREDVRCWWLLSLAKRGRWIRRGSLRHSYN
jgi:hypothetical protein